MKYRDAGGWGGASVLTVILGHFYRRQGASNAS